MIKRTDTRALLPFLFLVLLGWYNGALMAELGQPSTATTPRTPANQSGPASRPQPVQKQPVSDAQRPQTQAIRDTASEEEEEEEEETTAAAPVSAPAKAAATREQLSATPTVANNDEKEESDDEEAKDVENPEAKQKMLERLIRKFTLPNGKMASIVFLKPVNYVSPVIGDIVLATMHKAFSRYGEFNIAVKNVKLDTLTLEGFRGVVGKIKADVIFTTVLKPTHFDLFVFDRRTPYYIFYHTEVHPEEKSGPAPITEELAVDQTRVLLRRGLYLYLTNQFYELPRDKREVVMEAQLPRWMASSEMVEKVNRMMSRRFYTAASVGGAISTTSDSRSWSGGVLGFQIGARPFGSFYVEAAYEAFAYHLFLGSLRYNVSNKYSFIQVMPGLGGGFLTQRKSLEIDRNLTLHKNHYFIAPSVSVTMPLGELYFKVETQLLIALTGDKYVLNFLPGLLVQF